MSSSQSPTTTSAAPSSKKDDNNGHNNHNNDNDGRLPPSNRKKSTKTPPPQVTQQLLSQMIPYNFPTNHHHQSNSDNSSNTNNTNNTNNDNHNDQEPSTASQSQPPLSVLQLSQQHKVLLVFLRHFQCIYCQATILKVAAHRKVLLQLNTVPIFVHQESQQYANKHFSEFASFSKHQPIVNEILRIEDPAGGEIYGKFDLGLASVRGGELPLIQLVRSNSRLEKSQLGLRNQFTPNESRAQWNQMPGMFLIDRGQVSNLFRYRTIADHPQFLDLIIDPSQTSCGCPTVTDGSSFCDLSGRVNRFGGSSSATAKSPVMGRMCPPSSPPQQAQQEQEFSKQQESLVELVTVSTTDASPNRINDNLSNNNNNNNVQHSSNVDNMGGKAESASDNEELLPSRQKKEELIDPWKNVYTDDQTKAKRRACSCFCGGGGGRSRRYNEFVNDDESDETLIITDEISRGINLNEVMNVERAYRYFKLFCASEFSVENLLFLEAVKQYEKQEKEDERWKMAHQIFETFLTRDVPNEINTTRKLINQCSATLFANGPVTNLFSTIAYNVEVDQLSDTFARFKRTSDFELAARAIIRSNKQQLQ